MSFAIGLSGLNNAITRMDKAAAEVARTSVQPMTQVDEAALPTAAAAAGQAAPQPAPPVDLVSAVVEQISASSAYMANLKTIQATDENLKNLLK